MSTTCGVSTPPEPQRTTNPAIPATLRSVIGAGGRLQAVNPGSEPFKMIMENQPVALTCTNGVVSRVSRRVLKVPIAREQLKRLKPGVTRVTVTVSDRIFDVLRSQR